jgi:hypothetical protein
MAAVPTECPPGADNEAGERAEPEALLFEVGRAAVGDPGASRTPPSALMVGTYHCINRSPSRLVAENRVSVTGLHW